MSSEAEKIAAVATGDESALAELYGQYADKVYNTALSYTLNREDAEDITQDVFVKIHRASGQFRGDASLNTWIYRITVNTTINHVEKCRRYRLLKGNMTPPPAEAFRHPGALPENQEDTAELYRAIDKLTVNQKTAFILSYLEELPRQEVADVMGTTLKAVESLLHRAKRSMRTELKERYPGRLRSRQPSKIINRS